MLDRRFAALGCALALGACLGTIAIAQEKAPEARPLKVGVVDMGILFKRYVRKGELEQEVNQKKNRRYAGERRLEADGETLRNQLDTLPAGSKDWRDKRVELKLKVKEYEVQRETALASLGGGGLLVLERQGLVTLRRVPAASLLPAWEDEKGVTVAIVNTDTTGGSFLLVIGDRTEDRVWVPPRSIVLRTSFVPSEISSFGDGVRVLAGGSRTSLYRGRTRPPFPAVAYEGAAYTEAPRLVPRQRRMTLGWPHRTEPVPRGSPAWMPTVAGVLLLPTPGISATRADGRRIDFDWDGHSAVEVETVEVPSGPGVFEIFAMYDGRFVAPVQVGRECSELLIVYDPDMRIVDEREPRRRP